MLPEDLLRYCMLFCFIWNIRKVCRFTTYNQTVVSLLSRTHFVMGTFLYCYTFLLLMFWYTVSPSWPQWVAPWMPLRTCATEQWVGTYGRFCVLQDYVIYICHLFVNTIIHYAAFIILARGCCRQHQIFYRAIQDKLIVVEQANRPFSAWCFLLKCSSIFVTVVIQECPGNRFSPILFVTWHSLWFILILEIDHNYFYKNVLS